MELYCAQVSRRTRLYQAVLNAALEDRPCPSNAVLAKAAGYSGETALHDLAHKGVITITGRGPRRIVSFPVEGVSTLDPLEEIEDIFAKAAAIWSIRYADVIGPGRKVPFIRPRHAAFLVASEAGYTTTMIGEVIACDHSTVTHGRHMAKIWADRCSDFAVNLLALRRAAGL